MGTANFSLWSIIILFGAVQGFFLALYIFLKKENRAANNWLAFLLVAISLHLVEYAADITGLTLRYPVFIAITYPLLFCIGPFYYFYCSHLLNKNFTVKLKSLIHFIPSLTILLLMLPFYTMKAEEKIASMKVLSKENALQVPVEQLIFMGVHVFQTVFYIYVVRKFISKKVLEFRSYSSDVVVEKKLKWLNSFNLYFSVYLLLYLLLVILLSVISKYQVEFDYVLLLITSVSIYSIGYTAINNPEIFKAFPNLVAKPSENEKEPTPQSDIDSKKNPELKERLLQLMATNKPYLKSDLRISELADSLFVPGYQLSQLINDEFKMNFFDFINRYRVEDAKKLFIEGNHNYKILSIGYEVGFNSKATFNRVFKKFTGFTPSEYKLKFATEDGIISEDQE
ncbi:MAG: helix-turn-helix transcriptional regulator [Ferruginibacter sp.]